MAKLAALEALALAALCLALRACCLRLVAHGTFDLAKASLLVLASTTPLALARGHSRLDSGVLSVLLGKPRFCHDSNGLTDGQRQQ